MSKKAAIQLALATQMAIDGKPPLGLNGTLCGPLPTLPGEIANDAGRDVVRAHARELRDFCESPGRLETAAPVMTQILFARSSPRRPSSFVRTTRHSNSTGREFETAAAANSPLYLVIEMIADLTSVVDEKREDNKPAQK